MKASDYGDLIEVEEPPPPSVKSELAAHCWQFLGGWHPERLPIYAAIYGLEDPEEMVEMLLVIRDGAR